MFFNPNETYDMAIRSKDKGVLKALLVGIIGSDPTFATLEFEEASKYIHDKSIEINGQELNLDERYKKQEDEYEKEDWDETYYQMHLVWLRDNFAIADRLPRIKEIGKFVYENKQTMGKMKIESRRSVSSSCVTERKVDAPKSSLVRGGEGAYAEKGGLSKIMPNWVKENWYAVMVVVIILVAIFFFGYRTRQ